MVAAPVSESRPADRRWTRAAWLTVGGLVLFALCELLTFGAVTGHPTDGCLASQGSGNSQPISACIGDWPTPLHPGDEVLVVDGRSMTLDLQAVGSPPSPPDWVVGANVLYTVRRGGETLTLAVPLRRLDLGEVARLLTSDLPNLLENTLILLVTVFAFALRPGSPATRLLLLSQASSVITQSLSITSTLISETAWTYGPSPLLGIASALFNLSVGWLSLPAMLLLVLSFPRPLWPLTRSPRVGPALVFGVGGAAFLLVIVTNSIWPFLAQTSLYSAMVIIALAARILVAAPREHDATVRAQTAWMGLGLVALSTQVLLWIPSLIFPSYGVWLATNVVLSNIVWQLANLAPPICLAIAITRYRLFDIDVIVNRALVYGTLTAILALAYFGSVVVFQQVLSPFVGSRGDVAIVASTLAIAVLFQPLRRYVQATIDRRFYRRKYDAARVVAAFGARLRDEMDLDALSSSLVAVVGETLQPAHVSLRLASGSGSQEQPVDLR